MYEVEKGIPLPNRQKYPWQNLEIGDSFYVTPNEDEFFPRFKSRIYNVIRNARKSPSNIEGHQYDYRFEEGRGVRIWRAGEVMRIILLPPEKFYCKECDGFVAKMWSETELCSHCRKLKKPEAKANQKLKKPKAESKTSYVRTKFICPSCELTGVNKNNAEIGICTPCQIVYNQIKRGQGLQEKTIKRYEEKMAPFLVDFAEKRATLQSIGTALGVSRERVRQYLVLDEFKWVYERRAELEEIRNKRLPKPLSETQLKRLEQNKLYRDEILIGINLAKKLGLSVAEVFRLQKPEILKEYSNYLKWFRKINGKGPRKKKYPWHQLEIGDSFFALFETSPKQLIAVLRTRIGQVNKVTGKEFVIRKEELGIRVWRTK